VTPGKTIILGDDILRRPSHRPLPRPEVATEIVEERKRIAEQKRARQAERRARGMRP
jgi:hypothetical protein